MKYVIYTYQGFEVPVLVSAIANHKDLKLLTSEALSAGECIMVDNKIKVIKHGSVSLNIESVVGNCERDEDIINHWFNR